MPHVVRLGTAKPVVTCRLLQSCAVITISILQKEGGPCTSYTSKYHVDAIECSKIDAEVRILKKKKKRKKMEPTSQNYNFVNIFLKGSITTWTILKRFGSFES